MTQCLTLEMKRSREQVLTECKLPVNFDAVRNYTTDVSAMLLLHGTKNTFSIKKPGH